MTNLLIGPDALSLLAQVWVPIGTPGYSGAQKADRKALLDSRFGEDGWRYAHIVRGQSVRPEMAIVEYEEAYRRHLHATPALVQFLVNHCGNVYDDNITNVYDDNYVQPATAMNHYQDISVRRVIAELVDDPAWPGVTATEPGLADLVDLGDGTTHQLPRSPGFRGNGLLQIRDALSPGYLLNPALVPVHDPLLIATLPGGREWYHQEGCAHLSIEAFWQMSKVIEVRYDAFLALGDRRLHALDGL